MLIKNLIIVILKSFPKLKESLRRLEISLRKGRKFVSISRGICWATKMLRGVISLKANQTYRMFIFYRRKLYYSKL